MSDREFTDEIREPSPDEEDEEPSETLAAAVEEPRETEPEDMIGISDDEMKAYSLIISLGNITKGDLALLLREEDLDDAERIVKSLVEKNMAVELPGIVTRYQAVPPFEGLAEEVSQIGNRIESLRMELKEQVRNASTQVRDALLDLTSQTLDTTKNRETEIHKSKQAGLNRFESVLVNLRTQRESAQADFSSEMSDLSSSWSQNSISRVESSLAESKSNINSFKEEIDNELSSLGSDIETNLQTLNSDLNTALSNQVSTSISSINRQINVIQEAAASESESLEQNLTDTENRLKNTLQKTGERTRESLRNVSNELSTNLASAQEEMENSIATAVGSVRQSYDQLESDMVAAIEERKTREQAILDKHSEALDDSISAFDSSKNEALSNMQSSLQTASSEFSASAKNTVDLITEQTEGMTTRIRTLTDSTLDSMQRISSQAVQKSYDSLEEYSTENLEDSKQLLVQQEQQVSNAIRATGAYINSLNNESLNTITNLLDDHRSAITLDFKQTLESANAELEQLTQEAIAQLDSLAQTTQQELTDIIAQAKSKTRQMSSQAQDQMTSSLTSHITNLESEISEQITVSRTKHDELTNKIDSRIEGEIASSSDTFQAIRTKMSTSQEDLLRTSDERRRTSLGDVDAKLGEQKQSAETSLDQAAEETKQLLSTLHQSLDDSVQKMRSTGRAIGNSLQQSTDQLIEEHQAVKDQFIQTTRSQLNEQSQSFIGRVGTVASQGKAEARNKAELAMNSFSESLITIEGESASKIEGSLMTTESKLGAIADNLSDEMTNARTSVTSMLEGATNEIVDSLEGTKSGLLEEKTSLQSEINDNIASSLKGSKARLETSKMAVDSTTENIQNELETTENRLRTSISSAANQITSKATAGLAESLEKASNTVEGLVQNTRSDTEKNYDDLLGHISSMKTSLTNIVEKLEESPMIGLTAETLDEGFAAPAGKTIDATQVAESLTKIWEQLGTTEFPGAKRTWNVVTRKAILAHMQDMLSRAKSKVTMILPKAMDIPTEFLKELKSSIGVELVVTESPQLSEKASPIVGRGNIRVRSRSDKDVYACVRDSEEVLLAPATAKDSDTIGFVSEDDGFVRFVMSIVGPIFQARTNLLKAEDL